MTIDDIKLLYEQGKYVIGNKTSRYIAPGLSLHGDKFIQAVNKLHFTGIFLTFQSEEKSLNKYVLACVVDTKRSFKKTGVKTLAYLLELKQEFHGTIGKSFTLDTAYGSTFLLLPIMIPSSCIEAYDKMYKFVTLSNEEINDTPFKYSELYTPDLINKIKFRELPKQVLTRNSEYRQEFQDYLNNLAVMSTPFQATVTSKIKLPKDAELDFKPHPNDEILYI